MPHDEGHPKVAHETTSKVSPASITAATDTAREARHPFHVRLRWRRRISRELDRLLEDVLRR
jgi:hypothetical protein